MKTFIILILSALFSVFSISVNAATYADKMEWYEYNYDITANEIAKDYRSYIDDDRSRRDGSHRDVETVWYYWSYVPEFHKAGITGFVAEYEFYYENSNTKGYMRTRKGEKLLKGWNTVYAIYSNGKMQPFAVNDGDLYTFSIYNPLEKGNNFTKAK